MTETETTFEPNEQARKVFRAMSREAGDTLMERFFALWEAEDDARRAGSMAAHAFIRNAAQIAVFGARCAGHEPDPKLWLASCEEAFREAVVTVGEAFVRASIDDANGETRAS